jgi:hypothetical protein
MADSPPDSVRTVRSSGGGHNPPLGVVRPPVRPPEREKKTAWLGNASATWRTFLMAVHGPVLQTNFVVSTAGEMPMLKEEARARQQDHRGTAPCATQRDDLDR